MVLQRAMSLDLETPVCDLCGNPEQRVLFAVKDRRYGTPGEFNLVECTGCSLRYLSPRPGPAAMATWYPAVYPAYRTVGSSPLDRVAGWLDDLWNLVLSGFLADAADIRIYPRAGLTFKF